MTCEHVWARSLAWKPYPHSPKLAYQRVVCTCTVCGLVSMGRLTRISMPALKNALTKEKALGHTVIKLEAN